MFTRIVRPMLVVGLASIVCTVAGCRRPPAAAAAAASTTPATPASPDVWAVVNGREIHADEVRQAYHSTLDSSAPAASDEEALTLELNVLDQLITQDVLLARAQASSLSATDAEVNAAYTERKAGATDAAFQLQLSQRGLTPDDFRRGIQRELTVQKLLDRDVNAKATVSDQEVSDFFNKNQAQFNLAEPAYRLAQIVVTPSRDPQLHNRKNDDASTPAEAQKKAEMLINMLHGPNVDFAALAMDYSEDPQTVGQGGDLGFVPASTVARLSPQLRDAVQKMQPGGVTSMSVNGNFTILALVAKEPAGQRTLDSPGVKDNIRQTLQTRRQDLLRTAYLAAARNDAKVTDYLAHEIAEGKAGLKP